MIHAETFGDLAAALWFPGVIVALAVLFAAGLRVPIPAPGFKRWLARGAIGGGATCVISFEINTPVRALLRQ